MIKGHAIRDRPDEQRVGEAVREDLPRIMASLTELPVAAIRASGPVPAVFGLVDLRPESGHHRWI
jgi:hypothetical protein